MPTRDEWLDEQEAKKGRPAPRPPSRNSAHIIQGKK